MEKLVKIEERSINVYRRKTACHNFKFYDIFNKCLNSISNIRKKTITSDFPKQISGDNLTKWDLKIMIFFVS